MTDPQSVPPAYSPAPLTQPKGMSIAALVLGIASVVTGFFGLLGVLLGVLAVIFGFIARRRQPYARGLWLTGLILGVVGLILGLIIGGLQIALILAAINSGTTSP